MLLKVFIGYDPRQPVSYNVLQQSILTRSSKPVSVTPLVLEQLPISRVGLTPFTFTRFLVPFLCGYKGWALFLDIDMLVRDDIYKLFAMADDKYTVMVAKNPERFEWASAMLFNCAKCTMLTPAYVEDTNNKGLHSITWVKDEEIGELPLEWNHLVGYSKPRDDAKLVHFTQGMPCYKKTINCEHSQSWHEEHRYLNYIKPWEELMGNSVHAIEINGEKFPRFTAQQAVANGN